MNNLPAYLAIVVTIALTVGGQILQKCVADRRNASATQTAGTLAFYIRQKQFWGALFCLGFAMLAWLYALAFVEVGKAYALLSANYLLVPIVANALFNERMSRRQWCGALLLCVGLIVTGNS